MSDFICQKYTDCSSCSHYQKQIFKYRSFPKGMMIPKERCSQNTIYFLISGSVRVTSDEHPGTVFHDGQFIMQPIGSRVEFHILESTECILYLFETPQNICTDRFNKGLELAKESPMLPVVMDMCFPLRLFINGLKMYLNNELLCAEFLKAKQTELSFLLNCYYTLKEIATGFSLFSVKSITVSLFPSTKWFRFCKDIADVTLVFAADNRVVLFPIDGKAITFTS